MNGDGRGETEVAQNDQPIADRDENGHGEQQGCCAPVAAPEEPQNDNTREDVANVLDLHEGKDGGFRGSECRSQSTEVCKSDLTIR